MAERRPIRWCWCRLYEDAHPWSPSDPLEVALGLACPDRRVAWSVRREVSLPLVSRPAGQLADWLRWTVRDPAGSFTCSFQHRVDALTEAHMHAWDAGQSAATLALRRVARTGQAGLRREGPSEASQGPKRASPEGDRPDRPDPSS